MKDTMVTLDSAETMDLAAALLIYSNPRRKVFVTAHQVTNVAGKPQLDAGVPATAATLSQLLAPVAGALTFRGYLPERLLAVGPGAMAWWCPPGVRTLWFRSEGEKSAELGVRHGRTQQPGLVFAATGAKWYVFAVKGAARPQPDTRLYRAPYFNVWADKGEVCIGNVRTPDSIDHAAIAAWERAFFESRFTHPNPGFRVRFKGGGYALWKHLLARGAATPFPDRVLVPAQKTLAQFINAEILEAKQ